jgi:hypothetical protein
MAEELSQPRRVRVLSDLIERETDKKKLAMLANELREAIERERQLNCPPIYRTRSGA